MIVFKPDCTITIGGITLQFTRWLVEAGSLGTVGKVNIETTRTMLKKAGIRLQDMQQPVEIGITASDGDRSTRKVFGGIFEHKETAYLQDEVTLTGRDWSALLMDENRTLEGMGLRGTETPSQIASQIARVYGMTPLVDPSPMPPPNPLTANLPPQKRSLPAQPPWGILQRLAKEIGFECFCTPAKELVFKQQQDSSPLSMIWKPNPLTISNRDSGGIPLLDLRSGYAPRRNKTFRVEVKSTKPNSLERSGTSLYQVGEDQGVSGLLNVFNPLKAGTYVGATGGSGNGVPVYTFQKHGLSQDQCNQKAVAIARDIARREITIDGVICGYPDLKPQDNINLIETVQGDLDELAGRNFTVVNVNHSYGIPQLGAGDGFLTRFQALSIPPGATLDALQNLLGLFS